MTTDAQNQRIAYTAQLAYDYSPFWKEKMQQAGVRPNDIIDGESLRRAIAAGVRLTKQEYMTRLPEIMQGYASDLFWTPFWTSGSTGRPKAIPYGIDDLKRSNDQIAMLYDATTDPREYIINMLSPDPMGSGPLSFDSAKTTKYHMQRTPPGASAALVLGMIRSDPLARLHDRFSLWGLGNAVFQLGREMQKLGTKPAELRVHSILTGGETYTPARRDEIKELWGAQFVSDTWASTELSVISFYSPKCSLHLSHVTEDRLFTSVIDPEAFANGEVKYKGTGEEGIDIATTLYNEGERPVVIFLGYTLGDTVTETGEMCPCGRSYKTIKWPVFRRDEVVHLAGQNVFPVMGPEEALKGEPNVTGRHTAVYKPDESYLQIRVETTSPLTDEEERLLREKIFVHVVSNPAAEDIVRTRANFEVLFIEKDLFAGLEHLPQVQQYNQQGRRGKSLRLIRA